MVDDKRGSFSLSLDAGIYGWNEFDDMCKIHGFNKRSSYFQYLLKKDIEHSKLEKKYSEVPESIDEMQKDDENLDNVEIEYEEKMEADDILDENHDGKENETASDSEITDSDDENENTGDKEDE